MSQVQGDKWNLILDAAYELFGANGFYETKMSEIAERAGIAKGTLYLYFSSKEQLFTAMTKRDFEQFLEQLTNGLQQSESLKERLSEVASHHLRYFYNRRDYTKLFFMMPNNDPEMLQEIQSFMVQYIRILADMLEIDGFKEPKLLAKSFIGILDMMKMDILFDPSFQEEDVCQRVVFATDLFMNGCMHQK
ncbi:TetR/AcrR family transcriptional regulator [Paenibacillus sp. SC116]|uniref:TetR/AcrR family transcriptional regulator n=1 Tax=Paenibacillus sp. SC116 TaxID=2968986 RepID=UPI00215A3348|nr:TetR/AcrR family transcriptional regulator [Paenibacillus sp. SC116]MCR8843416.1 TetR/AcrR family transcriptional regulator [Paenibacillus sp. SC116]